MTNTRPTEVPMRRAPYMLSIGIESELGSKGVSMEVDDVDIL